MKKTLNILVVLALVNLAGAVLFWYGYSKMLDIKTEESDLRAQLVDEKQKGKKLDALRSTLASAAKDREQLGRYLVDPSDEDQIQLIAKMENIGTTTGVGVVTTSFDYQPVAKPPLLHGEFTLDGSWKQLYRFLRLMEEFPARVVINRYDVHMVSSSLVAGKSGQDNWGGNISIDFSGLKQSSN